MNGQVHSFYGEVYKLFLIFNTFVSCYNVITFNLIVLL